MIMTGITRGLLLGLLAAALCGTGYYLGHGRAEALGLAELNAFKVAREEEKRRDAETHAHALAEIVKAYVHHRTVMPNPDYLIIEITGRKI